MKDFDIYLAGGMGKFGKENFDKGNAWRIYCKETLKNYECNYNVNVVNPNDYFNFKEEPRRYKTEREIMEFDLNKVRNSDLIIINFNDMYSLGSMAELAIAYERRIPVIGLDIEKQNLHPWEVEMSTRIFNDIDECPPKVTVTVITAKNYSTIQKIIGVKQEDIYTSDIDVTNVISGILESDEPFIK